MADFEADRPGSATAAAAGRHQASPIPPSPRPSVASRASRSSLRREQEQHHEAPAHPRPSSVAYSRPQTPQTATAAPLDEPPPPSSPSPPAQPIQPSFSPLFALLSSTSHSSNRQSTHHPTVHYLFADDDPEVLTAALAQHQDGGAYADNTTADMKGTRDRAVILDMEPAADGSSRLEVAWASSLSPDWAVTSARVSRMENGDGGSGVKAGGPSGGMVLKIEGVSMEPSAAGGSSGKTPTPETELHSSGGSAGRGQAVPGAEEYGDLLQDFEKRMVVLRKVVEAGAARQRAFEDVGEQYSEATVMERVE